MLRILYLIPPRHSGQWVIREHKEGAYDIPHIPHLAPTLLGLIQREMTNIKIDVFDTQLDDLDYNSIKKIVDTLKPDIILTQIGSYTIPNDKPYAEFDYPTICITPESSDPVEIINYYDIRAKYFVKSEIESTILNGLKEFQHSKRITNTPGFIIKEDSGLTDTGNSQPYDLHKLPMPAYELFEVDKYFKLQDTETGSRCAFLYTTRGCIFKCKYCSTPEEKLVRSKSVPHIIEEIKYFYDNYGCRNFNFCDSTFSYDKKRVKDICEGIIKDDLKINFVINDNVNTVDDETMRELRNAGCSLIRFGIETGDEDILRSMSKTMTHEKIKNVFQSAKDQSISTDAFLMVGFPGETYKSLRSTYNLISQISPDRFTVSILFPKPFSTLYSKLKENKLLLEEDWSKYINPEKLLFKHDTYKTIKDVYAAKWWLLKKITRKLALEKFLLSEKNLNDIICLLISYLKTWKTLTVFVLFICSKSPYIRKIIFSMSDYDRMYYLSGTRGNKINKSIKPIEVCHNV